MKGFNIMKYDNNKIKIIIDTNIFINGWFFQSKYIDCYKIMTLIDKNEFQLIFAQDTIGELVYLTKIFVRHNVKFQKDRMNILNNIMTLFYHGTSVNTMDTISPKINDKYDVMFVKCAIESKANYIISDDYKSGMHIMEGLSFKVLDSKQFVQEYNSIQLNISNEETASTKDDDDKDTK
jgi:putative PIN family toxin of toxin-antitoxin system